MMSLINISYDTKEKKVTCSVDGTEVPDLSYVSIYRSCCGTEEYSEICVESRTMDEETGICYRKLMTANHLDAKGCELKEVPNSDGLFAFQSSSAKIKEDVSKMLCRS
jgi:hypothetical protein